MTYPLAGYIINPNGQTVTVDITSNTSTGQQATAYTTANGGSTISLPASITTTTGFYTGSGSWYLSVKVGSTETEGMVITLEDSQVYSIAVDTSAPDYYLSAGTGITIRGSSSAPIVGVTPNTYAGAYVPLPMGEHPIGDGIFWSELNASTGFPLPRPKSSTGGEVQTLLNGVGASTYYGLHHACMAPAGTVWYNGTSVTTDTILMVQRSGVNEGSSPYSAGTVYFATCAGGPGGTVSSPVAVYATPAGDDARQPGVQIRSDGVLVVVLGVRLDSSSTQITNGTVVIYSFDGGITWSTPGAGDFPNGVLSANYTELSGISGIVDLGMGSTYGGLGQSASVGVALCPWQGWVTSGQAYQSSGYYVGTYTSGSHITWNSSVVIVSGVTAGFDCVEPSIIITSPTNWVAFIRQNTASTEYQSISTNAGTSWSTPTLLPAFSAGDSPQYCYGGFHPVLAPNGTIVALARGNQAAYSTTRPCLVYSDNNAASWHGPFDVDNRAGLNNFDYGSPTFPPSRPGEMWLTYALSNNNYAGTANILGRCGDIAFYAGFDVLGGVHCNGVRSSGDVLISDGVLRMSNGPVINDFLGWVPSKPSSTWGGAHVGDYCLLTAPTISGTTMLIGWYYTAITVWSPMYVNTVANTPAVATPTLGAAAQLSNTTNNQTIVLTVTTAGTLTIAIGSTSSVTSTIVSAITAVVGQVITFPLPAAWYVAVTTSTTAVWTAKAIVTS